MEVIESAFFPRTISFTGYEDDIDYGRARIQNYIEASSSKKLYFYLIAIWKKLILVRQDSAEGFCTFCGQTDTQTTGAIIQWVSSPN